MIELLLVHAIDILLAGGGAFLVARGGRGRSFGFALLGVYAFAAIGNLISGTSTIGPLIGAVSAGVAWLAGRRAKLHTTS